MASATISQLSCFCSIYGVPSYRLNFRSFPNLRPKILVIVSNDEHATGSSKLETKTALSYTDDASVLQNGRSLKPKSAVGAPMPFEGQSEAAAEEHVASQQKGAAKIHDFCLGIPFGGIVLTTGLVGFVVSRNPATLRTGVFFGCPLLALSTLSLKIWSKGRSSLPFMLGQAGIAS